MNLYRTLKLYRFATVGNYIRRSLANADTVMPMLPQPRNRYMLAGDIMWCFFRYGLDLEDYTSFELWNKTHRQRNAYISARRNGRTIKMFSTPEGYERLSNKGTFNTQWARYIRRQWISTELSRWTEVEAFIRGQQRVIVKPLDGLGGHGVYILDVKDPEAEQQIQSLRTLAEQGHHHIIEEVIVNCPEIRRLAPGSLNTVRVATFLAADGHVEIMAVVLRLGSGTSVVDNYCEGGLCVPIDIERGVLRPVAYDRMHTQLTEHPYSHITFRDYPIPRITEMLQMARDLQLSIPECRYCGWDFAITPTGVDVIEGNTPPGGQLTQVYSQRGVWHDLLKMR